MSIVDIILKILQQHILGVVEKVYKRGKLPGSSNVLTNNNEIGFFLKIF